MGYKQELLAFQLKFTDILFFQWDGSLGLWEYSKEEPDSDDEMPSLGDSTTDSDSDQDIPRRSRRLRKKRRAQGIIGSYGQGDGTGTSLRF